jgi:hypothetical protein
MTLTMHKTYSYHRRLPKALRKGEAQPVVTLVDGTPDLEVRP